MSLRVLHVLDHSIPLHSGYTFRTLACCANSAAGLGNLSPDQPQAHRAVGAEDPVDGWHFHRTPRRLPSTRMPGPG
jgi:glycogen(starch) synthase